MSTPQEKRSPPFQMRLPEEFRQQLEEEMRNDGDNALASWIKRILRKELQARGITPKGWVSSPTLQLRWLIAALNIYCALIHSLTSSAFQAVIFAEIFTGLGNVPADTRRHNVACENGRHGMSLLCLIKPVWGNRP
jgi:hypothetical protein